MVETIRRSKDLKYFVVVLLALGLVACDLPDDKAIETRAAEAANLKTQLEYQTKISDNDRAMRMRIIDNCIALHRVPQFINGNIICKKD